MSARYYYSVDEQGSTDFITDRAGNVKNEYWYDAFGNVLDSRQEVYNRITYTGQQFDNITQQYYLRARFYNPVVGRFTQEDVYRGDGLNLYAYCGNNPVIYYDPSGYVHDGIPDPGDINFVGPIPSTGWKLSKKGAGAHLFERVNVKGRKKLKNFDLKETPRFYPYGSKYCAGAAHKKLHEVTKKHGIRLQGGNPDLSDEELRVEYREAYSDKALSMIRGDLRTPDSKNIVAEDVNPSEAFAALEDWEYKKRKKEEKNDRTNRCKEK